MKPTATAKKTHLCMLESIECTYIFCISEKSIIIFPELYIYTVKCWIDQKSLYIFICLYEFGVWSEDMAIHENISIFLSVVPTYMLCYV